MTAARLLIVCVVLGLPVAIAAGADERQQPVHLRADRIDISQKTGISHYRGHVVLTQGTLRLTADRAEAQQRGDVLEKVTAEGKPVTFRDRPEGQQEFIEGRATRAEYDAVAQQVHLYGDVDVQRGHDRFRAGVAHYDMQKETLQSEGDASQRVYATLTPPAKPATAPGDPQ
jgi:lipopolysaccharide export system protein LptA